MSPIAPRADLHRCPTELQQHCWLSEQHLTRSTERRLFRKRQGRQRAQQQLIRHSRSCSLYFELLDIGVDYP